MNAKQFDRGMNDGIAGRRAAFIHVTDTKTGKAWFERLGEVTGRYSKYTTGDDLASAYIGGYRAGFAG